MTEQIRGAWKRFNDLPSWQAVVIVAIMYGGGTTAYDALRAAWDRAGLTAAMEQRIIHRIDAAESNIVSRLQK